LFLYRAKKLFFTSFLGLLMGMSLLGCAAENKPQNQLRSDGNFSAPLPKSLNAANVSENNLIVEIIIDPDKEPQDRRRLQNLVVDPESKAFSGDIPGIIPAGPHTFRLVFTLNDASYGETEVAVSEDVNVEVIANQDTPVDFSAALMTLTDTDGDSRTNLEELERGWDPTLAAPAAPQNLSAIPSDQEVALTWDAVTGADSYTIYWNTTGNISAEDSSIVSLTGSSFRHTGLSNGTTHYYTIVAIGLGGESASLLEVSVTPNDGTAPIISILFPTQNALTSAKTLTITGTANDDDGVAAVRVNGISAQTNDGFLRWKAVVSLNPGNNTLVVETEDFYGNITPNATTIDVRRTTLLVRPQDLVLDLVENRAYVVDDGLDALVAIDLETGNSSIISDATTGSGISFRSPWGLELDPGGKRAFVADVGLNALVVVDLTNGNRSIISDATTGIGILFSQVSSVALDLEGNRAFVIDLISKAIFSVNLLTGNRVIISDAITGTGSPFSFPLGMELDLGGNRAFVVDEGTGDALVAVDLTTGNRSIVSDAQTGIGISFIQPVHVALDLVNNRAFVIDATLDALIVVDLSNGNRNIISDDETGSGSRFSTPWGVALDPVKNKVFVIDNDLDSLVEVDLITGNRDTVFHSNTGSGPSLINPWGIALDLVGNRAFVTGQRPDAILEVDLTNGNRRVVSNSEIGTGPQFLQPIGIALDLVGNRAFVTCRNASCRGLIEVDLANGDRKIISNDTVGEGGSFDLPNGIVLDILQNRVFIIDGGLRALVSVDLANGNRNIISDDTTGSGASFSQPRRISLDLVGNRAFVSDTGRLILVDLGTGDRTIVSDANIGSGPFFVGPYGLALDLVGNRVFVSDFGLDVLVAVDLATGNRRMISNADAGIQPPFSTPFGLALDLSSNRAFVVDASQHSLLTVELETGDRVVSSR